MSALRQHHGAPELRDETRQIRNELIHPRKAHDEIPIAGDVQGGDGHDEFKYDAWRVVMNMAIDYAWFSEDATMKAQIEKYHAFFSSRLGAGNVTNSLFRVDGSNPSGGGSTALTATLAAGSLASTHAQRTTYVENLWNVAQQSGTYRYYQEAVYTLGLLATAGWFGYEWAPVAQ